MMKRQTGAISSGTRNAGQDEQGRSFSIYRGGRMSPEVLFTINLVLAARRWRSLLDEHLRKIGQSSARMEALSAILNTPMSAQIDIARRLRIEGPTLTRMLDTLEADGLVERLADPDDRRTKKLRLTGEGEDVLEGIYETADRLRHRLLRDIPPETIDLLNDILGGLLGKLDKGLEPDGPAGDAERGQA